MSRKGILAVVSGFSGAGKGTLMKALLSEHADQYALSISATTRGPREGEVDGREYFFKTKDQFEQMIAEDALIEHACYVGNYYGTPKSYVMEQLDKGLIEEAGRLDLPGKPVAFQVTDTFLRVFGLGSLADLPPLHGEAAESAEPEETEGDDGQLEWK